MISRVLQYLRWRWGAPHPPDPNESPRDPYSYVRHPLVQRPGGRTNAAAIEEPEDDEALMLVGHARAGARH